METKDLNFNFSWWSLVRNFLIAIATGPYQLLILVVYLLEDKIPLSETGIRNIYWVTYATVVVLSIISWVLWTKVYFVIALISALVFTAQQARFMYLAKKG